LGDIGIDERKTLKGITEKQNMRVRTAFNWSRIGSSGNPS